MLHQPNLEPLVSGLLEQARASGIRHGFFTRKGGVSEGIYEGLNVGVGSDDDPGKVAENRRRVTAALGLGPDRLATLHQVHSPDAIVVREPFTDTRPKADAMVTDTPGIVLGVLAADCGPVLFADPHARIVGAAHAGWKGALTGVLESTVAAMEDLGARRENIAAALGPSIGPANYEVGPEFVERFLAADPGNERYFVASARPGHAMFDLNAYTLDRLAAAGVRAETLGHCTYADEALFYSYRRATHRGEPDYGRQVSAIVMEDA